jgi:uncharacterized protein YigE (DUF2233 family)
MTALFVIPLWLRRRRISQMLRRATIRTLMAAVVAMSLSLINAAMIVDMHGEQPAWLCVVSCTVDAAINALALFWASQNSGDRFVSTVSESFVLTTRVNIVSANTIE